MLETNRLILHSIDAETFKDLQKLSASELISKTALENEEAVVKDFKHLAYRFFEDNDGFVFWYVEEKSSGKIIGQVDLHTWVKRHDRAEVGYMFHKDSHGKGYATEASKVVIDYGFEELKLNRIEAYVAPENVASQNVLKKLNFSHEGMKKSHFKLEDGYSDSLVFGLLREELNSGGGSNL